MSTVKQPDTTVPTEPVTRDLNAPPRKQLSRAQSALLARMPQRPSDGLICRAGKRRTADSLVKLGLAVQVSWRRYARLEE